jgi:hypothetical protein
MHFGCRCRAGGPAAGEVISMIEGLALLATAADRLRVARAREVNR